MKYIGIDIGSSYLKSAVIDLDRAVIAEEKKLPSPEKIRHADTKLFEVPAQAYVECVQTLIDFYTKKYPGIEGVVFSTQMHGFVYRTPAHDDIYVSWQDMRCLNIREGTDESYMAFLEKKFPPQAMENMGVRIKPSLGMCNLYTLLESDSSISRNGELYTIGSYVIHKLTGRNICHMTNAAPLGLLDVRHGCWSREIIHALGFDRIRLPELAGSDTQLCGRYAANGQSLKIFPDYGDQQTAILGSMAEPGDAVINIATSSQVSVTVDTFVPGEYEVRPFFGKRYINTISNMPGGRVLNVLVQFVKGLVRDVAGVTADEAQIWEIIHGGFTGNSDGIRVDTSFYARPGFLDGGSVCGILPENLSIHTLFCAAYHDMARMYWENIRTLKDTVDAYVCAGGVSWKSPELLRTIQEVSGIQCKLSAIADECLSGLFQMAMACSGIPEEQRRRRSLQMVDETTREERTTK